MKRCPFQKPKYIPSDEQVAVPNDGTAACFCSTKLSDSVMDSVGRPYLRVSRKDFLGRGRTNIVNIWQNTPFHL